MKIEEFLEVYTPQEIEKVENKKKKKAMYREIIFWENMLAILSMKEPEGK
jgi:hypothetical protein